MSLFSVTHQLVLFILWIKTLTTLYVFCKKLHYWNLNWSAHLDTPQLHLLFLQELAIPPPRKLSNSLHVHIRKMRHSWAGQPNSCSNYNLTGWHLERRSETPLDSTNPKCWNWLRSHRYVRSLPNLWYRFFNLPATYSSNQWENQD